jgi:RNA polymerase sigma-70 factor (ECF subfamily)
VDQPDLPDASDSELLAATARESGGAAAFEILYRRYERRVYRYALTFLKRPALAEEVVIDTMLAVWHGAAGFAGTSRASTWVLGIARHKALDAVRKAASPIQAVELEQAAEIADAAPGPSDTTERSVEAQLMRRAIARLSEDHQEILQLAFYEDLPYEEIATLLSIPDNTVKTRVFYAKQQLRRHLEQMGVEQMGVESER